jgi:hypothetical protein
MNRMSKTSTARQAVLVLFLLTFAVRSQASAQLMDGDCRDDLAGVPLPATSCDWQRALLNLLSEIVMFLRQLREAILHLSPD